MAGKKGELYKKPLSDIKRNLEKRGVSKAYAKRVVQLVASDPNYRKDLQRMMYYRTQAKAAMRGGKKAEADRYIGFYGNRLAKVEQKAVLKLTKKALKEAARKKRKAS
ncbi:MAG: hypothetical protein ACE5J7_03210 [Candidatus Aenigmatarchaeota archaeon]